MSVASFVLASLCVVLLPTRGVLAQTDGVLQVGDEISRFLTRQQTSGRIPEAILTSQPLAGHVAVGLLDSLANDIRLTSGERRVLAGLRGATPPSLVNKLRSVAPYLYANGVDLVELAGDGYRVQLNPLLNVHVGRAKLSERVDQPSSAPVWQSTRGVRGSGAIGRHVFFESRLEETQQRVVDADYDDQSKTAPRLGKATYDESREVVDYMIATGLVGFRSRFVEVRFGRDRNRWGTALGGIALSNYGTVYDQLQIRTTVGPVQYTNLFVSLATGRVDPRDGVIPKKYAALHRLVVQLPKRIELAFTESVVFATDSLGARKSFDVAYLNPVIFLRAVEADRGSPDNVLLGASASWVAVPGYRVYGGLFLDELRVPEIGKKWWANKWAVQVGGHIIPHPAIDIRVEYTRLRPYLYAHREPLNAYTHYRDVLGHPAGPNAVDVLVEIEARPLDRFTSRITMYRTVRGRDTLGVNMGSNPLLSNSTRPADRDVAILQGIREVTVYVDALASYEILPRLYADLRLTYGSTDDDLLGLERFVQPMLGIRWGLQPSSQRY